jgi:hypothetical protein
MPATVLTKEIFPSDTSVERMEEEVRLRIKATAIRSWFEKHGEQWVLFTEWNVIGEQ